MTYTTDQVSKLLGKSPRTLYRMHVEHGLGQVQDVAEGRRLLFTEQEFKQLEFLLKDKSRERLMQDHRVLDIVTSLMDRPMTIYDLVRCTGMTKSVVTTLVSTMTPVFWELTEDQRGLLHWDAYTVEPHEGECVRYAYRSTYTGKIVTMNTFSDVLVPHDKGYILLSRDACTYETDVDGHYIYVNDIVQVRGSRIVATKDFKGTGKVVGTVYEEQEWIHG